MCAFLPCTMTSVFALLVTFASCKFHLMSLGRVVSPPLFRLSPWPLFSPFILSLCFCLVLSRLLFLPFPWASFHCLIICWYYFLNLLLWFELLLTLLGPVVWTWDRRPTFGHWNIGGAGELLIQEKDSRTMFSPNTVWWQHVSDHACHGYFELIRGGRAQWTAVQLYNEK